MIMETSNSFLMLEQSMRFLWTKQSAILDNISNVETPGYKAKTVTFEESLRDRLQAASSDSSSLNDYRSALRDATPVLHVAQNESARMDGNGVNVTDQSLELSRNAYQLQYTINAISTDYSTLRAAIRG